MKAIVVTEEAAGTAGMTCRRGRRPTYVPSNTAGRAQQRHGAGKDNRRFSGCV